MSSREEQRAYQRAWLRERRDQWIRENGPCAECGSSVDLEVDHVDPRLKSIAVARIWSRADRHKELEKCQVLCGDCHRKKTAKELSQAHPGSVNPRAKLSTADILAIRSSSKPAKQLAANYGVAVRTIYKIRSKERWKSV